VALYLPQWLPDAERPRLDTALAAAVVTGHSPYERAAIRPRGRLIVDARHSVNDIENMIVLGRLEYPS
jgi:hypothetical protein